MKLVPVSGQKKGHSQEELYNLTGLSYYDSIESTPVSFWRRWALPAFSPMLR
jgi:hypothetical protein